MEELASMVIVQDVVDEHKGLLNKYVNLLKEAKRAVVKLIDARPIKEKRRAELKNARDLVPIQCSNFWNKTSVLNDVLRLLLASFAEVLAEFSCLRDSFET
ncbi:unnamed protein product [Lepeophtheirus salmonis]|uniref:(salmon louse) hypothetical protein n=1 Tax=Lepeophtheirus salmonis TaxID=72036 RepID=A0A7R8CT55_LEPSM|nr:unnamed protein product [Lepeophtheirus salmonis]CAF2921010.1 unnamed protein product [Lepeophtheirus salmonis]